jgi:hypothetical protein
MASPAPTAPRTRRSRLRLAAAAALGIAVVALTLSGCVSLKTVAAQQEDLIGAIDIVVTGCGSKANTTGCGLGNSGLESNTTATGQVLLGVQIDSRFVPPATFKTNFSDGQQPFTASPSYTAELTRLSPPDPGRKWAGYISDARTYTPGKLVTAQVPIIRTVLPDGSPSPSGFGFTWVIGSRGVIEPDSPATRAVACGDDLSAASIPNLTICKDAGGGLGASGFNDFAFLTPAPVTVQPGQTAIVPVVGKLTGPAAAGINFALTASTTVPGATALTNVPTLAPPGESTTSVTVSVPVPPSTTPGTYAVTLTGTLATGETRVATGTVKVDGPGSGGGVAGLSVLSGLKISRTSISSARGAAPAVISVTLAQPGRLRVLLDRVLSGRRKNGVCVAPTAKLRRAGARRCSRFIAVSSFTRVGLGAGVAKVSISGRGGGRRRPSGTYRVTLTHLSATGVASVPLRTTLTITR